LFAGTNVSNLRWVGGHFLGHVFDPAKATNTWEPNANTRGIVITTTPGGHSEDLTFREITSDGMAGAVITVLGAEKKGSDREVETYARNVTVENCTLERSGKFMWDYGYLWQITVWPEDYNADQRAMAAKYFRHDLVRGPVRMAAGEDRVWFDNTRPLPLTKSDANGHNAVCFFGDALPSNLVRGRQYFVVESALEFIRVAEQPGGAAIRFASDGGPNAKLIADLFQAHPALHAPAGCGPGKGAFDLVGCEQVVVRGCRLSALGDTMHIQKSRDILFTDNVITGSRMGAFFLAEFCRDARIVNNRVDGTNGSRVMSIEKSAENVTVTGNTFVNGGRGSWINQPRKLVLEGNVFTNNTTKCERNPHRGRRSFVTGDYEQYAEMYFTILRRRVRSVRVRVLPAHPDADLPRKPCLVYDLGGVDRVVVHLERGSGALDFSSRLVRQTPRARATHVMSRRFGFRGLDTRERQFQRQLQIDPSRPATSDAPPRRDAHDDGTPWPLIVAVTSRHRWMSTLGHARLSS
jgi:hypothetical protein